MAPRDLGIVFGGSAGLPAIEKRERQGTNHAVLEYAGHRQPSHEVASLRPPAA